MAKAVIMPKFGFTQETAEVLAWLVNEGDHVDAGDPIMEVSTDKVSMEVEAPTSGILAGFKYKVGDVVPVTEIIAYILAPGEAVPALTDTALTPHPSPERGVPLGEGSPDGEDTARRVRTTPLASRIAQAQAVDVTQITGSGPRGRVTARDVQNAAQSQDVVGTGRALSAGGKVSASPAARRLAETYGIALAEVQGTGYAGRIQSADIEAYADALREATAAAERLGTSAAGQDDVERTRHATSLQTESLTSLAPPFNAAAASPSLYTERGSGGEVNDEVKSIPFNNMRRTIARNLQKSMQDAPHIYFTTDVDMTAANALVANANANPPQGVKVTLTAVITKAVAWTLRRHPLLNAHLRGEELLVYNAVNVGIAVALENGLIVPVIRDADRKGVYELAAEIRKLGQAAQAGKLGLDDIQGATFTISNLGMFAVDQFTAIINPPQVGILAVGRARKVFVPDADDQPVLRPMAAFTLSVDHRAIDGAVAARFISDLAAALANPERLLL
jgi:pyruvate dehydrogenase E2 component (dihydrolipoamide acetyltransferase)